jgi:4-hydroxy-tetrahydrodipicolinate reductase
MNIALVGYGKMGRMIERVATERGHTVVGRFDIDNNVNGAGLTAETLAGADAAIEFTTPDTALVNIRRLVALNIPTVVGTTGWLAHLEEVRQLVAEHNAAFVYGSNFSIGMNLFFKIVHDAAALFARYAEYDPYLLEAHHKFKKDAPSGTALSIAQQVAASYGERTPEFSVIRAGYIPGTHEVGFDSEADTVTLTHTARSRVGFASGAVLAAEMLAGKTGFYEFPELLFAK